MLEGHLLDERYLIKKTIGGGGMANVYLATDTILSRDVAVKVLRLEYANDEEFIERFHREAQAATSLSHPNIVNIFDVGEEEHILYMAMEYVDGLTLKEYIQKYGPIGVEESLRIMQQVTSAIAHAHANDLVHRDIKPQNILMDNSGQVKVTDFGIAIALSATSLTRTNSILGSVHYLSPEQARGGMATKKSDIYSLGIVLFELLTGKLPFTGQSPVSIALKHLQSDPPSIRAIDPSIPQSVENIVLQAMAKDPFHRYIGVTEMHTALEHALDPNRLQEPKFSPPVEAGEETKAIPVITDDHMGIEPDQETMIHRTDAQTIRMDSAAVETEQEPLDTMKKKKKKKKKKPKKKKRKWLWIGLALFIVVLSAVLALFLLPSLFKLKDVTIPDVIEQPIDEAIEMLEALNLVVQEETTFSEDIEEGHVVKTDPKAGRTVKEESTVKVYVSDGKEKFEFDNYVGYDFEQAERLLEEKGFTDIISYEKHSDKPVGEILSQVQPDSGSLVVPSETRVIFEVSIGPETFQLKDLVGLSLEEAESYADNNSLTLNKEEVHSDSVEKGLIVKQNPGANASVKEGSTVQVSVSLGPEEKPPNLHTVIFSVPYTNAPDDEDSNKEREPQTVTIYVKDMNNKIEDVYKQETITEDKEYTITLTIKEGDTAEYRVERDGEVLTQKEIP